MIMFFIIFRLFSTEAFVSGVSSGVLYFQTWGEDMVLVVDLIEGCQDAIEVSWDGSHDKAGGFCDTYIPPGPSVMP